MQWDQPPSDAKTAARPYRRYARRGKLSWILSAGIAAILAAIPAFVLGIGAGALVDSGAVAGLGFTAIFVPVFLLIFLGLMRGQVRYQSQLWGLGAFLRGYARERGLGLEHGHRFHASHVMLPTQAGGITYALSGTLPGSGREGSLLVGTSHPEGPARPKGPKHKGLHAAMALLLDADAVEQIDPVMLLPEQARRQASLGGFVIDGVDGLRESEVDRAAREHAERLAADLLAGSEEIGVAVEAGGLLVFTSPRPIEAWSTDGLDDFCAEALALAERAEDVLGSETAV